MEGREKRRRVKKNGEKKKSDLRMSVDAEGGYCGKKKSNGHENVKLGTAATINPNPGCLKAPSEARRTKK